MSQLVDFYHYTREDRAQSIISSRQINETLDGGPDAKLGRGVYGTKVPPKAGKAQIARNNWTGGWDSRIRGGSVEFVFHLKIPRNRLEEQTYPPNRQLYVHRGPIELDQYEWECLQV